MPKKNYRIIKITSRIKVEVAIEVISLCIAKALYENNTDELRELNNLKEQIYQGDKKTINRVLDQYGNKIKDMLVKKMTLNNVEEIKKKYALTQEEFEEMYSMVIAMTFQNIKPENGQPIAIVIGGQPGAGKSGIVLKSRNDFIGSQKEAIVLDLDIYRGVYKNSIEIAKNYPTLYTEITNVAAGKIMERLSEVVIRNGYNFIFEGTMGKSIYTVDLLQQLNANYKIIARLMATSREESILSMFERYLAMKRSVGIGRLTTIEDHDVRYENFPNIAGTLEGRGIEVEVYERSNDVAKPKMTYKTSFNDNTYSSVNEALSRGREVSYNECMKNAENRLLAINSEMRLIGDDVLLSDQLEKLNSIFKDHLRRIK